MSNKYDRRKYLGQSYDAILDDLLRRVYRLERLHAISTPRHAKIEIYQDITKEIRQE